MADYSTLAKRWGGVCVICGEPFLNPNSITREHLVPRSVAKFPNNRKGRKAARNNIAPSHYACNSVRGDLPLMEAICLVEMIRKRLDKDFTSWVNRNVPNRNPNTVRL